MSDDTSSQTVKNLDGGIQESGLICFDVSGLALDRELICILARRLSKPGAEATRLRLLLNQAVSCELSEKGGILSALRNSPLVGANVDMILGRSVDQGAR